MCTLSCLIYSLFPAGSSTGKSENFVVQKNELYGIMDGMMELKNNEAYVSVTSQIPADNNGAYGQIL